MHRIITLLAFGLLLASCAGNSVDISTVPELPEITADGINSLLTDSEEPVVVNVWASWCVPCRSEAPLLERAAVADDVTFVGVNVRDDQDGARGFIAEFFPEAPIAHYFDRSGDVPVALGATRGVPITLFYAPGGELVHIHSGVIDERTLALQIDEIRAR